MSSNGKATRTIAPSPMPRKKLTQQAHALYADADKMLVVDEAVIAPLYWYASPSITRRISCIPSPSRATTTSSLGHPEVTLNPTNLSPLRNAGGGALEIILPFVRNQRREHLFETFGSDRSDRAPIVLIHGSAITGRTDCTPSPRCSLTARSVASSCRIVVVTAKAAIRIFPTLQGDGCRHRGLDPRTDYERAHIIGHSNGGNVALVTLLEHPRWCRPAFRKPPTPMSHNS
jgi:hypothetical protein